MHCILLHHQTKPGARLEVEQVWLKHMRPAIAENAGHRLYAYSFGSDDNEIVAFQVYGSAEEASAFVQSPSYLAYETEVSRLLEGPPRVEILQPRWIKGISQGIA